MRGGEIGKRLIVFEQSRAQRLQSSMLGGRLVGIAPQGGEVLADGRRIHVAHQPAYVLHLPALCFVALDALCVEHRSEQGLRQAHRLQLGRAEPDQLGAERLQGVHFLLAPRLAGSFFLHRAV